VPSPIVDAVKMVAAAIRDNVGEDGEVGGWR